LPLQVKPLAEVEAESVPELFTKAVAVVVQLLLSVTVTV
jgi:hypothetical protein